MDEGEVDRHTNLHNGVTNPRRAMEGSGPKVTNILHEMTRQPGWMVLLVASVSLDVGG